MPAPDFAEQERVLHAFEREQRERDAHFKDFLREEAGEVAVADYEVKMREIGSGVQNARAVWHSISDAQRRVLATMHDEGDGRAQRESQFASPRAMYLTRAKRPAGAGLTIGRLPSLRTLAERGLIEWQGGAFDPEKEAALTEQGRFVLAKGRPPAGQRFKGFRA